MGIREHRRALAVAVFLLTSPVATARAFQGNAVTGTVYSTDDKPLENVSVSLVQDKRVRDKSRREDGLYVLEVPSSIKKFDLLFEHPDYLKGIDQEIANRNPPIKRPIVFMTPKSLSYLIRLPERDLDRIVAAAREAYERGAKEDSVALFEAGRANLKDLLEAARSFRKDAGDIIERLAETSAAKEAQANAAQGVKVSTVRLEQAELLIKQAIAIQERVLGAGSIELAGTLETYAALLRERGREGDAQNVARRAEVIRSMNSPATGARSSPPADNPPPASKKATKKARPRP